MHYWALVSEPVYARVDNFFRAVAVAQPPPGTPRAVELAAPVEGAQVSVTCLQLAAAETVGASAATTETVAIAAEPTAIGIIYSRNVCKSWHGKSGKN